MTQPSTDPLGVEIALAGLYTLTLNQPFKVQCAMNKPLRPTALKLTLILAVGLLCVSSGSIFVRLSQEAPSLTIAFFRMLGASLLLSPFYWLGKGRRPISSWALQLVAGGALALHFAFWIASLRYTSVAVSVLLVNTSPALVAAYSYLFLGEKLSWRGFLGLLCSFLGGAVLLWNDVEQFGEWKGSLLALLGAVMLATYLLVGSRFRRSTSLVNYVYPTYLLAALLLGGIVAVIGLPVTGFSTKTYLYLGLLGLIPQFIGHTSYNWALRFLSATLVSTIILGEPVLATLMAWWILGEGVSGMVFLGAGLVGIGIFTVSRWGIRQDPTAQSRQTGERTG